LWHAPSFLAGLQHPIARAGFEKDMGALRWCQACVLVLPCGRSAHLEIGWAAGAGKRTIVMLDQFSEPELMYLMCDTLVVTSDELDAALAAPDVAERIND
jgi:hypothetical protein